MKIISKDIHGNEHVVEAQNLDFAMSIYGVVIHDNKVLILPTWDGYDFPGGGIEKGENHLDAIKREIKEETGLGVEPKELINVYTSFYKSHKNEKNYHYLMIYYFCDLVGGEISSEGFTEAEKKYAKEARFVSSSELEKMKYVCGFEDLVKIVTEKLSFKK
ncbi:MAG: NUDIX domain-containing protein [Alphaproteobacteria bacterium]